MLRAEPTSQWPGSVLQTLNRRACTRDGSRVRRRSLVVEQVARDYRNLTDALIELLLEANVSVTVAELQTLDRCFDSAIAGALTLDDNW